MHIFVQTPNQIDYNISTYRTGAYNFEVSTESAEFANITAEAFAESIQLNNLNNIVSFKTDFGLEFSHEGYTATVRLPIIFGGHVQGLCGDYNGIKQDDYRLRNGTVLEYSESGYDRTNSEFECAKSWIINGTVGPDPNDIRQELENCQFQQECEDMFTADWLESCNQLLDPWSFIDTCMIDYCIEPSDEVRIDLIKNYVQECTKRDPFNEAVCIWKEQLGIASCDGDGPLVWSGCHKSCHTCDTECESKEVQEGCFCPDGQEFDKNTGECVVPDCNAFQWGQCSKSCGGGESVRLGFVGGKIIEQKRRCNVESCPIEIEELNECSPCESGLWLCHSDNCRLGETCQKTNLINNEYRCLPSTVGECKAWGDPHVVTFDGASNDVYGIGNYTFMELNYTAIDLAFNDTNNGSLDYDYYLDIDTAVSSPPGFALVMETAPFGQVSAVERFFVFVDSPQYKVCWTELQSKNPIFML